MDVASKIEVDETHEAGPARTSTTSSVAPHHILTSLLNDQSIMKSTFLADSNIEVDHGWKRGLRKADNTTTVTSLDSRKSYKNITTVDGDTTENGLNKTMSHSHKSPITMFMLLCLLIVVLYALKRWIQYYLYYNRKSKIRRYFDFGTDPSSRTGNQGGGAYSGVSGDEFDELLVGVFENDDFTQFEDDDSDESIESILSQWSGKHSQGGGGDKENGDDDNDNQRRKQKGGATSSEHHHMEMVDLDLGADGGEGGIVSMDMDTKLNLHEQNG